MNPTQKNIRNLSIAILIMGGLTLIYTYVQMVSQLWLHNFITPMVWNPEIKGWQIFILAARLVGATLLFGMCCLFLYRINKGLKERDVFPRSNVALIRWAALVAALLAFVHSNYGAVVKGESELMVDSNTILSFFSCRKSRFQCTLFAGRCQQKEQHRGCCRSL